MSLTSSSCCLTRPDFFFCSLTHHCRFQDALQQLWPHPHPHPGAPPPFDTLVSLLRLCATSPDISHVNILSHHIRYRGLGRSPILGGLLVQLYGDCGCLEDACTVFACIHPHTVFTWNVIIRAYAKNAQHLDALCFLHQMHHEGILPDKITLISILSLCTHESALYEGQKVHVILLEGPLLGCPKVRNGLLNMYSKSCSLQVVQREFDTMAERNVVSWTSVIAACIQNNADMKATQLFQQMRQEGTLPDKTAFVTMLGACTERLAFLEGKRMHASIDSFEGPLDVVIGTALINMYSKCSSLEYALKIFQLMPEKNIVTWTAIIESLTCYKQGKQALQFYDRMQCEGLSPNKFTFVSVLDAIGSVGDLLKGKQVNAVVISPQFDSDVLVDTAVVNMYGKCGTLDQVDDAFHKSLNRYDVRMWAALISVYVQNQKSEKGLQFFSRMMQEGVFANDMSVVGALDACASLASLCHGKWIHVYAMETKLEFNILVSNAIIDLYGKCGSLPDAWRIFNQMKEYDTISWNSMVTTYARHGHGKAALHLFHRMLNEGVTINQVSFLTLISACGHAGLVNEGLQCFKMLFVKQGLVPVIRHYNSLIDLLGRAGRLDEAQRLTADMELQPDLVSLITLLFADASQGMNCISSDDDLESFMIAANDVACSSHGYG